LNSPAGWRDGFELAWNNKPEITCEGYSNKEVYKIEEQAYIRGLFAGRDGEWLDTIRKSNND
jgi:hypothetical protein